MCDLNLITILTQPLHKFNNEVKTSNRPELQLQYLKEIVYVCYFNKNVFKMIKERKTPVASYELLQKKLFFAIEMCGKVAKLF